MNDRNPPESWKRITCIMMVHAGHQNKEITVAAYCSLNNLKTIRHELENSDGDYEAVARKSNITDDLIVFVQLNSSKIGRKKSWKTQATELGLCHVN